MLFRIFPSDVMAVMLLLLNKEITPILVPQTNPLISEFYDYENNLFSLAQSDK